MHSSAVVCLSCALTRSEGKPSADSKWPSGRFKQASQPCAVPLHHRSALFAALRLDAALATLPAALLRSRPGCSCLLCLPCLLLSKVFVPAFGSAPKCSSGASPTCNLNLNSEPTPQLVTICNRSEYRAAGASTAAVTGSQATVVATAGQTSWAQNTLAMHTAADAASMHSVYMCQGFPLACRALTASEQTHEQMLILPSTLQPTSCMCLAARTSRMYSCTSSSSAAAP